MINIFYGPHKEFEKCLPQGMRPKSLSELLEEIEFNRNTIIVKSEEKSKAKGKKKSIRNIVIRSYEYSRLTESGLNGFLTLLSSYKIKNIYLQNPPNIIVKQLKDNYGDEIKFKYHHYKVFEDKVLDEFVRDFDLRILGQKIAGYRLLSQLYTLKKGYNNNKPLVLLFYGPTGVGKTETAKYLSELLNEKLFRKQLSMYQNEEFANYVFGSKVSESSLARDLLERESNIILLDEFDKINSVFYSAFYQMFDEGVFVDKNYEVELKNSIIICTSNFSNIKDIKKHLGEPIFSRLDNIIEYYPLQDIDVKKLIEKYFKQIYDILSNEEQEIIDKERILDKVLKNSKKMKNAREINVVTKDFIFAAIIKQKYLN